jgi:nicotinamidase/pyrazinamidase
MERRLIIDRKKDALVIVDLQNDFCPGGALAVPDGDKIVPVVNALIPKFENVFTTQDWHPADHISFEAHGGSWPPHCVVGTPGVDLHPRLIIENTIQIHKGGESDKETYSGFQDTDLEDQLKNRGDVRIFVCGLATDYCVKATVLDGIRSGFEVMVIADAIKGVEVKPGDSDAAIESMKNAGATIIGSESLS